MDMENLIGYVDTDPTTYDELMSHKLMSVDRLRYAELTEWKPQYDGDIDKEIEYVFSEENKMGAAELIGVSNEAMDAAPGSDVDNQGRVYLLKFQMPDDGKVVYKVGVTHGRSAKKRLVQICEGMFDVYREMPRAKIQRDRKSGDPFVDEKKIHALLAPYSYEPGRRFGGSTEFFYCTKEVAKKAYHEIIPE
ncbi:MAG: GIY-YIG nuclease family protein [Euryarchaeota archaeon]|nr:GIY-YIG nuclease family protein [Euryarchaeota archaeon]